MAVLPQFGGLAEAQMRALMRDSGGTLLSAVAATGKNGYQPYNDCAAVVSGAQSELTCNGGGVVLPSRKRGREAGIEHYVSSSALLPVPGMQKEVVLSPPDMGRTASRTQPGMTSTSGRPAAAAVVSTVADALVSELCQHGAEIDALVQTECERLRAGLEHAHKRQRQALVRAVAGAAERRLQEKEAELDAARRRAAELEERCRQAAAESQAWCGLARSHEAAAAGIRATLDQLLLRGVASPVEGFGESDPAPSDVQSSCFEAVAAPPDTAGAAATSPSANKWACRACGERKASVLLLPCRHLCLCKACEPRLDACPVCVAPKNASIHIAEN